MPTIEDKLQSGSILITGAGAVGMGVAEALTWAGYDVQIYTKELALRHAKVILDPDWSFDPTETKYLLRTGDAIKPDGLLVHQLLWSIADLSKYNDDYVTLWRRNSTAILTAANPKETQSLESAQNNYVIDKNSIDTALQANIKTIIYLSSVWRTMTISDYAATGIVGVDANVHGVRQTPYGFFKNETIEYMREKAEEHADTLFVYIDLGGYPREGQDGRGAPGSLLDEHLPYLLLERELQIGFIELVEGTQNPLVRELAGDSNILGLTVVSDSPSNKSDRYNLASTRRLFRANVDTSLYVPSTENFRCFPIFDGLVE